MNRRLAIVAVIAGLAFLALSMLVMVPGPYSAVSW